MDERFEQYQKEQDQILRRKDRIVKDAQQMLQFNLSGTRSFLLSLTSFSLVVLGGAIAVMDKIDASRYWPLLFFGAICLLTSAVASIVYLHGRYHSENRDITEYFRFQRGAADEANNKLNNYYNEGKPFPEYKNSYYELHDSKHEEEEALLKKYRDNNPEEDHWPKRIVFLFVIGFISFALFFAPIFFLKITSEMFYPFNSHLQPIIILNQQSFVDSGSSMFWLIFIFTISLILSWIRLGIANKKVEDIKDDKNSLLKLQLLEFWNGLINFFIAGLTGYFFVLYRLPNIKIDGLLGVSDFGLALVFLMGAFGHLHILSNNITNSIAAIISRVFERKS